ncbi:MAG: undecaprenyl-diphosphate phosphatase [Gammaproteobacteria bacterium]|nr:undecaprenyl-diphosphate phosphatase [Gammaproteobacteria bacterium]
MDVLHALYLALIQGLTEFLPISSSAHLIFLPRLFGWSDQGLAFDVAVHVGTLVAVVSYFWRDLHVLARSWVDSLLGGPTCAESKLAWAVLLGAIPVALAGLLFGSVVESQLRHPIPIASATIGFAILLWWADVRGTRQRDEHDLNWKDVVIVGCAQASALIPGASRSGVTITAGLWLGLTRVAAARFSFLLSIPVIVLAGSWKFWHLLHQEAPVAWLVLIVGATVAAITAYICIHYFLRLIDRIHMLPFVIYRLLVGIGLLFVYT